MNHQHLSAAADAMLRQGLDLAGFHVSRQHIARATNIRRFQANYGCSPVVCVAIWEELTTTGIPEAHIHPPKTGTLEKFLMTLYFLKVYATEEKLAGFSKLCEKTARHWVWVLARKIQALKAKKVRRKFEFADCHHTNVLSQELKTFSFKQIVWPEEWTVAANVRLPIFLYSVDGVHCRTNEEKHPTLAQNTKLYSHKFNQAGFAYELALSLTDNRLIWMTGPFLGSKHDITIFRDHGLKEKTPAGKKGIADKGYRGEKEILCTPNSHDPAELREFKVRIKSLLFLANCLQQHSMIYSSCFILVLSNTEQS